MKVLLAAIAFAALALSAAPHAAAQELRPPEGAHYGLLRGRDLTPFGFLRLDMRPAHNVSAAPGEWGVEVNLGYQNTWALSSNVETYLTGLQGRRRLGPDEFQAIRELPGEAYLVDFELGLLDLALHRKIDDHWWVSAGVGLVAFGGGFLDGLIEGFHERFGYDSYGRPAVRRNGVNFLFDLAGLQAQGQGLTRRGGVLDPTLAVRYAASPRPSRWNLVLEGAVKVPIGGRRDFLSNGHFDTGVQATLQRVSGRHAAYLGASVVHTRVSLAGRALGREVVPSSVLGYEYAWTPATTLVGQFSVSRSAVDRGVTALDSLLDPKYQYAIGLRHRAGRALLTAAITENVLKTNNTPDFGFQLGFGWLP